MELPQTVIQKNAIATFEKKIAIATLNHLAKWLSVRLSTKRFWVQVHLQSFKLQFRACFEQYFPYFTLNVQKQSSEGVL